MKTNTPRTKEKEVRIKEIEEAAKKVFFERGYQKSSVDEIAKIANVSKGTIYLYFKNKEDLYISLMLPMFHEFTRLLESFEERADANQFKSSFEFFREFANIALRAYEYDPDGFMVFRAFQLADFFSQVSNATFERINEVARKNNFIARRIMSKAIEAGLLPPHDISKITDIIWGLFIGVMQVELDKLRWTKKDHIKETLDYAFAVLSSGFEKRVEIGNIKK